MHSPGTWFLFQPHRRRPSGHVGAHMIASLWGDRLYLPAKQLMYAEKCQPVAMTYSPLYDTVSRAWQRCPA